MKNYREIKISFFLVMFFFFSQGFAITNDHLNNKKEFSLILNELKNPEGIVVALGAPDEDTAISLSQSWN